MEMPAIWRKLKIHNKIMIFSLAIAGMVFLNVFTDLWVGEVFLMDLRSNLEASERVGTFVKTMEEEKRLFSNYMRSSTAEPTELEAAMEATQKAAGELDCNYLHIGAERYALTTAILRAYENYDERRGSFLTWPEDREGYLIELYEIYEMQEYLMTYSGELMTMTTEAGNELYQEIFPKMVVFPIILLILSGIVLVGTIQLTQAMNYSLVEPVLSLAEASRKIAENDYSGEDIYVDSEDEIADLVHAFNKMKVVTSDYIGALEERRETLELLHAEEMRNIAIENQLEHTKFEALRNQMNPHFLFNTLNVIGGMANLEDAELTEKMIKALSNLFRYNLRNEDREIPLEQDLKIVEDYLYLQKMRFGERIKWKILYEEELREYLVPTFMFQPLVENSIVHGIAPKVEGGLITISIEKCLDVLRVMVRDTGVGMDEEQLKGVKSRLTDTDAVHRGIGVGNIYRRLHLMYEDCKFDIQSTRGEGTTISVEFPARTYDA